MTRQADYMDAAAFSASLAEGAYAWPGGYPRFYVMADGGVLAFSAAQAEAARILEAIAETEADPAWREANAQWLPASCAINWEDADLTCDHTGARIESAYGEA